MVEHVPTGTPLTDPKMIDWFRGVVAGKVLYVYRGKPGGMRMYCPKNWKAPSVPLSYGGLLDDEYSVYIGEWLGKIIPVKVGKYITPDTHDAHIDWVETTSNYLTLTAYMASLVIKRIEVMKW